MAGASIDGIEKSIFLSSSGWCTDARCPLEDLHFFPFSDRRRTCGER